MDEKGLLLKDQKVLFVKEPKSKTTFFNQETFMFEFFFFFFDQKRTTLLAPQKFEFSKLQINLKIKSDQENQTLKSKK